MYKDEEDQTPLFIRSFFLLILSKLFCLLRTDY